MLRKISVLLAVVALVMLLAPRAAEASLEPGVTVSDQAISGGLVVVSKVVAAQPGWIVIHAGSEGFPVLGATYVPTGETENVVVRIDMSRATPQMSAMLHVDAGEPGVYEFPGADGPVRGADDRPINPPFQAIGVHVDDQFVTMDNTVTIGHVIAQEDGWIVIHASSEGAPVVGYAPIAAGVNTEVAVTLDPEKVTPRMTAMIHVDAGEKGVYEFPGADGPARIAPEGTPPALGGGIVNEPFWTTDYVRTSGQVVGEGGLVIVDSVLASADGWMVIHATSEGNPVIGYAPVAAGLNKNVEVQVDMDRLTPVVLAMLHVDAGEPGVYEFPGADGPVRDPNGTVIAPPLMTGNGVRVADQSYEAAMANGFVVVDAVTSAANGWMVIHATSEGNPVIGAQFVAQGYNPRVVVKIDTARATDTLLAMLHVDAGEPGVYEFPGADGPVRDPGGNVIAPPFMLMK